MNQPPAGSTGRPATRAAGRRHRPAPRRIRRPSERASRAGRRRVRVRFWTTAGVSAGGLGLLVWLLLSGGWLAAVDVGVRRWTGGAPAHGWYGPLYGVTLLGQRAVTVPLVLAAAAGVGRRDRVWRPLLVTAGALATLGIVVEAFKRWVGRLAPHALVVALHAGGMSFPGGHAANVVLSGGLLLSLARSTRAGRRHGRVLLAGWVAVSTAVGLASVLVGFHWVSDVAAGWLLGALLLTLTPPVTTGARTARRGASSVGARSDGEGAQGHLPSSPRSGHARRTLTTRGGCGSPAVVRVEGEQPAVDLDRRQ